MGLPSCWRTGCDPPVCITRFRPREPRAYQEAEESAECHSVGGVRDGGGGGGGWGGGGGSGGGPAWARSRKRSSSTGKGSTRVEFFSAATATTVCSRRIWRAEWVSAISFAASAS